MVEYDPCRSPVFPIDRFDNLLSAATLKNTFLHNEFDLFVMQNPIDLCVQHGHSKRRLLNQSLENIVGAQVYFCTAGL